MNNMSKQDGNTNTTAIRASLKKRYARERRFQWYGRLAVLTGFVFLFILLADIVSKGYPAFTQHYLKVSVELDAQQLGLGPDASAVIKGRFTSVSMAVDNSILAFSAASFNRCKAILSFLRSIP